MHAMRSVWALGLTYMMLGTNTDRVPSEYRQDTDRSEKVYMYIYTVWLKSRYSYMVLCRHCRVSMIDMNI